MSQPPSGPERYRTPADAPRASPGRGQAVTYDPLRRRADLLSATETAVLASSGPWGTLDELSARAAESGAIGTRAAVRAALGDLVERGVLTPEAELLAILGRGADERARARGSGREEPAPEVATIGIPTRGRPDSLKRALESFARDVAETGRAIDFVIVDDAEGAAADRGREIGRDVERRFGVRVRYADSAGKARFAERIARESGAPVEVVRAALMPDAGGVFAAGAARNLLLLDGAGRCALQVDDDTVCDLRPATGVERGLRLRSFEDPTEVWCDGGRGGDGEARPGYAALHERLLGRSAGSLIRRAIAEGGVDPGRASTGLLERIAAGGRVACTQIGVRGDSAMGAMGYLLTVGQPSRGRLLASEAVYRRTLETRRLTRAVTAETLTDGEHCMTFAIGLDERTHLPPFPATYRNEDGLFGNVIVTCEPTAAFGHLPFTLGHEPEDQRDKPFDRVFDQVGRVGVNDFIAGIVGQSRNEVDTRSPAAAMQSLGRSVIAWCDVPAGELLERIWWLLGRRLAQRLARIEALLREGRRQPAFWARDLERLADVIRERAEDPERAVPFELAGVEDRAAARRIAIGRARAYGELLVGWPAMLEAAAALRSRGTVLGEDDA